ncbi:uncharacterized protein LOC108049623 [Drosophila rhopaloa]|uniref:HMG box domain-containing protein n=1 Tax=Drosophila rhopaloa TaxID=1041015 RepID=A0ABM5HWD6_DRORH|nr:uncharacterized protein LOC108049623 [Drosophila rhopaloa]
MGRAEKMCTGKTACCCLVSKATSISKHSIKSGDRFAFRGDGTGRNPFFRFLAHFRKCYKDRLCHLPPGQVTLMGSRVWKCMTLAEKEPFIAAARMFSYTFRSRSKKVNWLLAKLRESAVELECQGTAQWMLINGIKTWEQCVLNDLLDRG